MLSEMKTCSEGIKMGCCCYPETNPDGTRNCGTVSDKDACGLGGIYSDGDCPLCFFVTELSSHVVSESRHDLAVEISARPGLMVAFDFRDIILRRSELGREVVELYSAHARQVIEILRRRPRLLRRTLVVVAKGILIAQDMLRSHTLRNFRVATGALKLDHDTARELVGLVREFGEMSEASEFRHLVSRVEAIVSQISGMTGREILNYLSVEEPGTAA
jgi:hypothetical protein